VQRQQPIVLWWHVGTPSCARGVVWSVLNTGVAHLPGYARTQGTRRRFQVPEAIKDRRRRVVWYLALRSLHVAHERSEREVSEGVCLLEFYTE
jgi:hypothetical protein